MMADLKGVSYWLRDGITPQAVRIRAIDHIHLVTPAGQRLTDHLCQYRVPTEVIRRIKSCHVTESHVEEQYNERYCCGEKIVLGIYYMQVIGLQKQ